MKPILCLDFDNTIHGYQSGWQGASVIPDPPVPGALEFIVTALEHFTVAVHSSRSHQWGGRRAMKRWLRDRLIEVGQQEPMPLWWIKRVDMTPGAQDWHDQCYFAAARVVAEVQWPLFKPPATVSIDDRAINFDGHWPRISTLQKFKPWNKRG